MNKHYPGEKVVVTITSLAPYGAFASLADGSSGLIHISEIDEKFISSISAYLPIGSKREVVITGEGKKPGTYAFSLKRLAKRRRQVIREAKKPMSRKEFNKAKLDSYGFETLAGQLDNMVNSEYSRLK